MSAKPVLPACLAVAAALVLVGCVNQNTWSPTVDPYTDVNAARRGTDEAQCRQIATQASGGSTYAQATQQFPKLANDRNLSCWYLGADGHWYAGGPEGLHPDC